MLLKLHNCDTCHIDIRHTFHMSHATNHMPLVIVENANSELLVNMSSLDEFYPAVVISTLLRIIKDQTLSQFHIKVVQVCSDGWVKVWVGFRFD